MIDLIGTSGAKQPPGAKDEVFVLSHPSLVAIFGCVVCVRVRCVLVIVTVF